jgi:signal transduction histidine kinase
VHRQISDLLRDTPPAVTPEVARSGPLGALQQVVNVELAAAFDEVTWEVPGELVARARSMPALAAEVLFYAAREAVRNAARHGRGGAEGRPLRLHVTAAWDAEGLTVTVEDNGVGLVAEEDSSGRGLALHSTMLAVVGGTLALASEPGAYTRVSLSLPAAALEEAEREREAIS